MDVPRPSSSKITKLLEEAVRRISLVSDISTMKVDFPRDSMSDAGRLFKRTNAVDGSEVRTSHPRVYSVQKTQSNRFSRYVCPDLCHDAYESNHTNSGTFAAHVWTGHNLVPRIGLPSKSAGVRYERVGSKGLYHGMSTVDNLQHVVVVKFGSMVILLERYMGEAEQTVRNSQFVDHISKDTIIFL